MGDGIKKLTGLSYVEGGYCSHSMNNFKLSIHGMTHMKHKPYQCDFSTIQSITENRKNNRMMNFHYNGRKIIF